jgi:hypothetical protein
MGWGKGWLEARGWIPVAVGTEKAMRTPATREHEVLLVQNDPRIQIAKVGLMTLWAPGPLSSLQA